MIWVANIVGWRIEFLAVEVSLPDIDLLSFKVSFPLVEQQLQRVLMVVAEELRALHGECEAEIAVRVAFVHAVDVGQRQAEVDGVVDAVAQLAFAADDTFCVTASTPSICTGVLYLSSP